MICKGKYNKNDRLCELCLQTNVNEANECRKVTKEKENLETWKNIKAEKCKYRFSYYSEHDLYYGCSINGDCSKYAPDCKPTKNCHKKGNNSIESNFSK